MIDFALARQDLYDIFLCKTGRDDNKIPNDIISVSKWTIGIRKGLLILTN